ncbi:MAG: hypothetical protein BHW00_05355 [Clostridium sp. 26_22]|nr:MAG: hypothetical protein BHW00_05355 [Clostridium sp. 26_22]
MSKKIFSVILSIALLFVLKNYSNAANATIQCSSEAKVNSPLTISVSGSAVQWNLHLKVNGQTIASNSEVENVEGNKTISFSGTYTPTSEGNITVTLDGSATEASDGSTITSFASKTVSVKKAENNNNSNNASNSNSNSNSNTQQQPQTKSNVATLANLGIKGQYDFTGFRAAKTSYSVTVPNEAESVEIYASKGQSGQKIIGTGVKQLKEGTNAINVVVTAEDGTTTKTYTINIERKSAETTDNKEENTEEQPEETSTEEEETFGLKDLKIDGLELTPEFKTDVYEYSAELKEDKTSLELTTIATEENAEIEVTGNEDLKDGENIITVIVKEKDTDKTATYQITVNKIKEETNITEATVNNIDNKTKEMIILGIGILALIIVVIIIVIVNKKRNSNNGQEYYYSELYNNDESEENINEENQDEQEEYDEEIEEKKKKKHSKGKRFK